MYRLGLNHDDLRTYQQALTWTHERKIHLHILDLQMNHLRSITADVVDGQVVIDTSQAPTRSLSLTILDKNQSLAFEPDGPGPKLWRSRLIRVVVAVRVSALSDWIECPVFTGPVWDFTRQGALVNITAHGMEQLALGQAWVAHTYPKKSLRTAAIKSIMGRVGEDCHAVPDLNYVFPHRFTLHKTDSPWKRARKIAESMNRYLFYDGHGTLQLRHFNDRPVFTFDSELLSFPSFERSKDPIKNTFEVIGKKPKGAKHRVRAVEYAPGLLSPATLGRGSGDLYLVDTVTNDHLRTHAEADAVATRRRNHHVQQRVTVSFDSLPLYHLEEHDRVAVTSTGVGRIRLRLNQWTIPLGGADGSAPPMTVGSVKRTTSHHHRRRKHHGG